MITKTIFPAKYIQGSNALEELLPEFNALGTRGLLLADPFASEHILPAYASLDIPNLVTEVFSGECCEPEIRRLEALCKQDGIDVVIGMGGGKTIDTAKAVSHYCGIPVIVVPTLASTDAPCSALSVVYTETGEFSEYLVLPKNPAVVLVDSTIVAQAPVRFLKAGMGDALATWFEARSCKVSQKANMTGFPGSLTAHALAELCFDTLMAYGTQAVAACEAQVVTPALDHVIEANTLLSGLGFESGGLASAHAIHNGLTVLEQTHAYFHGEKVAFGTLAGLFLTDQPTDLIERVYGFCRSIGLPVSLADIGLERTGDADLMDVARATTDKAETIHNEPVAVTAEMVFAALKAADRFGKTLD